MLAAPLAAPARDLGLGPSGILAAANREELAPLTIASGKAVSQGAYDLTSGTYYDLTIRADGTTQQKLLGAEFFRAVWVDKIQTESGTLYPVGLSGVQMEDEAEITISFVAILPGRYVLEIPGARGDRQRAIFTITGR